LKIHNRQLDDKKLTLLSAAAHRIVKQK